ncbi:MAG: cytochrome c-type biogenesis protein CcmH [Anaerolineae bacterium]
MRRRSLVLLFVLLLTLAGAAVASAQGGLSNDEIDRRMRAITDRLNCPLCQNTTLTECPLQVCDEMRDLIRQKLVAGENEDQIRAYFVERYGDRVLNEPPRQGFALLGWVMPFVGIVVGVVLLALVLRAMLRREPKKPALSASAPAPAAPPDLPAEYVDRLERELRQME